MSVTDGVQFIGDRRRLPLAPTGGEGWGEGASHDIFRALTLLSTMVSTKQYVFSKTSNRMTPPSLQIRNTDPARNMVENMADSMEFSPMDSARKAVQFQIVKDVKDDKDK